MAAAGSNLHPTIKLVNKFFEKYKADLNKTNTKHSKQSILDTVLLNQNCPEDSSLWNAKK